MIEASPSLPRWMIVVFAVLVIGLGGALVILSNQIGDTLTAIQLTQDNIQDAQGSIDANQVELNDIGVALGSVEGEVVQRFAEYIRRLERKLQQVGEPLPSFAQPSAGGSADEGPAGNPGGEKDGKDGSEPPSGGGGGGTDGGSEDGGGGPPEGPPGGSPPSPGPESPLEEVIEAACERVPQLCGELPAGGGRG